ncbi:MAG TPA: hypothetical protein VF002_03060 [Gaiellaceae bacterium]
MPGRLGPRFAIEALFLIALAVGAGFADLATTWILLLMLAGWLVVSLLELTTERVWAAVPPWRRPGYMAVTARPRRAELAEPEPEPEAAAEPDAEPLPELEPATVIVSRLEVDAVALPEASARPELTREEEPEPPAWTPREPAWGFQPEPEAEPERESEPDFQPEPRSDSEPGAEPEAVVVSRLEVDAVVLPEQNERAGPEPAQEPGAEPGAEPEPEPEAEPEPATGIVSPLEVEAAALPGRRPDDAPEPVQAESEPEPEPEPEAPGEPEPTPAELPPAAAGEAERPSRPTLEPLRPRPRRRWFRRRGEEPAEPVEPEPLPKHVRLLPTPSRPDRISDEVAEIFDVSDREHRQ